MIKIYAQKNEIIIYLESKNNNKTNYNSIIPFSAIECQELHITSARKRDQYPICPSCATQ